MATTLELAKYIGLNGTLSTGALRVPITISDARQVFDRVDVLVEPVGGVGVQWVSIERIKLGTFTKQPEGSTTPLMLANWIIKHQADQAKKT